MPSNMFLAIMCYIGFGFGAFGVAMESHLLALLSGIVFGLALNFLYMSAAHYKRMAILMGDLVNEVQREQI